MRPLMIALALAMAGTGLTACETAGVNEGPVEYATRPDYRDVYRRPPPPPVRYDTYRRYDDRDAYYDAPPPPPPPRRYYRPYDGYSPYDAY
ncbi:hypothetical protein GCM10011390_04500 [Aureimonas endophytica]|uniref:PXPV repeat-containing protein n=1 Tax=Aureimonas endophytica TaxID=2027858 RepID=A0A917E199_9HYPH|nr:hypothetical protein [Aureimonas endophytica]GGD88839.1 hypothetical protein GCM10011390_04500 [Aureimonas endophytica]